MYQKSTSSWIKHWDFELIDVLCMEFSFFFAYILRHDFSITYMRDAYTKMGLNLLIINIAAVFVLKSYKGILVRNKWQEFMAVFKHVTIVQLLFLLYEYMLKEAEVLSRAVFLLSWFFSLVVCYFARVIWKKIIRKKIVAESAQTQMLVLTSENNLETCMEGIIKKEWLGFEISRIAIIESDGTIDNAYGIPVIKGKEEIIEYIRQEVVDEVFIDRFESRTELCEWVDIFLAMGITIHVSMGFLPEHLPNKIVNKIGNSNVITSSIRVATPLENACKRIMDMVGGIVGLMLTGVAYIFVAPLIKKASPGPVFFRQARVGKNGRLFYIYKFRSMYMDAEERKKDLMKYNEMQGLMFKMENDPRIIGSEKGPGKGIGNFIRKTSIDELPQFWNILKGDMSLVGTRPPTVNEYEQYELHHKIRLSMKPGLTGMWQTSGRSEITDFEEVVRLDTEYIENWSLWLDIKLILKTVKVVLDRKGSK